MFILGVLIIAVSVLVGFICAGSAVNVPNVPKWIDRVFAAALWGLGIGIVCVIVGAFNWLVS